MYRGGGGLGGSTGLGNIPKKKQYFLTASLMMAQLNNLRPDKQIKDYANRAEKREGAQIQMQIEEKLGVVQVGSAPHYWIILHP